MKKLKESYDCLKVLSTCKPQLRKTIVAQADKKTIDALCECVLNVLNGNVKLDHKTLKKLNKHKSCFRKLINSRETIKQKKNILNQNGGAWIPFLIPPILEVAKHIFNL